MNLFFDTSALVKFFHQETGTEVVTELINNTQNKVWISELTIIEFLSVLYRLYREEKILDEDMEETINGFEDECQNFVIIPLNIAIIEEAKSLLGKFGKTFPVRTLDLLQLASCSLVYKDDMDWVVVSSDDRFIFIAQGMNMQITKLDIQK